jgi:hypothetical protein
MPEINQKQQPDGRLTSFVTEFCSYLNGSAQDSQALVSWYNKVLKALLETNNIDKQRWALSIANTAQSRFANDPVLIDLINQLNTRVSNPALR